MIDGKSILAIIPARAGSKGVKDKNIRKINGKPLIAWTIDVAIKSKYIDKLILSSEDDKICKIAKKLSCDVPFVRPAEYALDETPMIKVIHHAILNMNDKYDYVVLLQPTSPLRETEDIDQAISLCISKKAPSCVTICESNKSPYWMYMREEDEILKPFISYPEHLFDRRQSLPTVYMLNGAVFVAECDWILSKNSFMSEDTVSYIMEQSKSFDIDTELDFIIAESMLVNRYKVQQ